MILFRFIIYTVGCLLMLLSLLLLVPFGLALYDREPTTVAWLLCAWSALFLGIGGFFVGSDPWRSFSLRQSTAVIVASWISLSVAAAVPFMVVVEDLSLVDALFEGVSGITATGASIFRAPHEQWRSVLLWRALLQWIGGLGVVVVAVMILPILKVGGLQFFRQSFQEDFEKTTPRIARVGRQLVVVYVAMTAALVFTLIRMGLPEFDALMVTFSGVSTGGFTPQSGSIGFYQNPAAEWAIWVTMVVSALPLLLVFASFSGSPLALLQDQQARAFLLLLFLVIAAVALLLYQRGYYSWEESLRLAAFNVTSLFTGTGFTTADFSQWPAFFNGIFLAIMLLGGCSGSTVCGLKIFRAQILAAILRSHWQKMLYPHHILTLKYNGRLLTEQTMISVLVFCVSYGAMFALGTLLLTLDGLDGLSALSATAATLANVGVALGPLVGPSGSFAELSDYVKIVLVGLMLLGRLELVPLLLLLSARFWRR